MGRVLTNNVSLAYAVESSLGVLPGTPLWKTLEPNEISAIGAEITKVARSPISPSRQRRKGTTVDLDSSLEFEHDLTKEVFIDFIEGFLFATALNPFSGSTTRQPPLRSGADYQDLASTTAVSNRYTHDAITTAMTAGRLVFARGFSAAASNGMHSVAASSTTTATLVNEAVAIETPGSTQNATLEIAGHRAGTGEWTWTNATKTLARATGTLDFTTFGLSPGQFCHIGGLTSTNQFAGGKGYGRILSISATALVFDKFSGSLIADDTGTGKQIDLLFGRFIRNVLTSATEYIERSYQFEETLPNLGLTPGVAEYIYSKGNLGNEVTFQLPLTEKALVSFGFVGTDTDNPTTSRKTNAANAAAPVQTVAYNTTSDIAQLGIKNVSGTELTSCFKSCDITLNNQVSPEKCLGTLGASFMNFGNFLVDMEAQILLTDSRVVTAIRNNETLTFATVLKNDDGAIALDVPSMTLGDGSQELPLNESVSVNLSGEAFRDATLGYTLGVSLIPAVPTT